MGGICSAAVGKLVASTMNFSPASTSYNALQASFVGIGQLCGFPCVIPLVRMEFKCYWLVSFSSRVPLGARGGHISVNVFLVRLFGRKGPRQLVMLWDADCYLGGVENSAKQLE